uniref:Serine protease K12H4.7 n=1 Tax=Parascaris equorum TaxID=6256 RepID=A0A914S769_PAREQ
MLSAWFRQFYPELSVGAIASSAPVEAKVDFYEYLIVVENALRVFNAQCAENVKLAFDQIHQLSLKPEWNLTTEVSDLDIQYFFSILYDKFQGAVQYNNDNSGSYATGGGIREVCGYMLNDAKTPVKNVADGTNVLFTNGNIDPWHALSKYDGTGSVTTVLMNGTAHCADMYPPRDEDAADLAPTRELIAEKIAEWLGN